MVAHQILDLLVLVRTQLGLQKRSSERGAFFYVDIEKIYRIKVLSYILLMFTERELHRLSILWSIL